jgi:hypothetical protein
MSAVTLQATGYPPMTIDGWMVADHTEALPGDKRGVRISVYVDTKNVRWVCVEYVTKWPIERPVSHLHGFDPATMTTSTTEAIAAWVRELSRSILPPGAGFPALPQYEARQERLRGMMETLTLHCLTAVLKQLTTNNTRTA